MFDAKIFVYTSKYLKDQESSKSRRISMNTPQKIKSNFVFRSLQEVLPYKIHLVLLFGLSILSSVLNLAPALVFQIAIDDYILKKDLNGLYLILFGLFLLGLLLSVQSFFQQKLSDVYRPKHGPQFTG